MVKVSATVKISKTSAKVKISKTSPTMKISKENVKISKIGFACRLLRNLYLTRTNDMDSKGQRVLTKCKDHLLMDVRQSAR